VYARTPQSPYGWIDLGTEPPLAVFSRSGDQPSRGRISARWLAGTILTGLAGMGLMLAAATSAIEHRGASVSEPELIRPRESASFLSGELTVAARKGDRLVQRADIIAARQTYKTPIVAKSNNADVIRLASFTRIGTPLALESLGFASSVPAFNAGRLIADASEDRAFEGAATTGADADVALVSRAMNEAGATEAAGQTLGPDEAREQVLEALAAARRTAQSLPAQMLLAKAMREPGAFAPLNFAGPGTEPFSRLVVRMVQENVSVIPRLEAALARNAVEQQAVVIRSEDHAGSLLRQAGASQTQARDIIRSLQRGGQPLDAGKRLKLTQQALETGAPKSLVRVDLYAEESRIASAGRKDDNTFVLTEITRSSTASRRNEDDEEEGGFPLYNSIHETARKHGIPVAMIEEMIRVLFFDVDLQRAVRGGDAMEVLISNDDAESPAELQMLSVTIGGETRRFYRYPLPNDDVVDYFDDQGRSAKKFLIRKPVVEGDMRSVFGMRRHPILGYYRMHNGVDWAARVGTPILAAGNGTIRSAGWDSGYGRRVEIQHTNGYVTTYSHMSAFGRGITEGARVRQGQVIGYLGSSGLSTGPHLHYEVMINERHVDPLAIKLPRGRELEGSTLAEFRRLREQIDQILKKAPGNTAVVASQPGPRN